MLTAHDTTAAPTKEIGYDRETRDYFAKVDGNLIGYYPTYLQAERAADDYMYGLLTFEQPQAPVAETVETSAEIVQEVAARLATGASDRATVNAINKAAFHLAAGVDHSWANGDLLIASGSRTNTIHRVKPQGDGWACSCEAGSKNTSCWHAAAAQILTLAQQHPVKRTPDKAAIEQAVAGLYQVGFENGVKHTLKILGIEDAPPRFAVAA